MALLIATALLGAPICVAGERVGAADRPHDSVDRSEGATYVEEMIVTAERLKKGAIPTQTVIVQTYDALRRGKRLYNARRYGEALPHLLLAAKRGFKWAQAMAGDIYLHGRGGVPRSILGCPDKDALPTERPRSLPSELPWPRTIVRSQHTTES